LFQYPAFQAQREEPEICVFLITEIKMQKTSMKEFQLEILADANPGFFAGRSFHEHRRVGCRYW